jgi:hypothetical protein
MTSLKENDREPKERASHHKNRYSNEEQQTPDMKVLNRAQVKLNY